ncbi:MAG: patatin-like phospholipase family protein, partial [Anaerolineales bacterium]|nr:patatin-like phospholipase family protein [Anaerolineales bacterium]
MEYDLVFEGGGAKGMVFVGAMQEFEARGHKIGRLLGTSAGAITATFLAAGYTSEEMLAALQEQVDHQSVFTTFMGIPQEFDNHTIQKSILYSLFESVDVPFVSERFEHRFDELIIERLMELPTFRHLFSFLERGGWYAAESFLSWVERKLNSGEYEGQPRQFGSLTLGEMHAATGKDLSLIAADITHGRMLVLNHRTAPDCPVIWAVRMSMSIPLLWQE